jgi:glycosyltransferase involved in cell wall biosynthesis
MKNISVVVGVYNEEKRIKRFLSSFLWFGEIIVIDKSSTDNTVPICKEKGANVITIPYTDSPNIYKNGVDAASNEWILLVTASDIIHPELSRELINIINSNPDIDQVYVPYMMYNLGVNSKHSVFDIDYRPWLFKKNIVTFNDLIHQELSFKANKIYKIEKSRIIAIHHLTHQTLDSSYERHIRYSREELKKGRSLFRCSIDILRVFLIGVKKRFWKIGWDGLALLLVLLDYHIMIFLRTWERTKDIESYYTDIEKKFINNKSENI